jgi:hypothetical protein
VTCEAEYVLCSRDAETRSEENYKAAERLGARVGASVAGPSRQALIQPTLSGVEGRVSLFHALLPICH